MFELGFTEIIVIAAALGVIAAIVAALRASK
jgi:hypothetical protein